MLMRHAAAADAAHDATRRSNRHLMQREARADASFARLIADMLTLSPPTLPLRCLPPFRLLPLLPPFSP